MRLKFLSALLMLSPLLISGPKVKNNALFPVMKDGKTGYINARGELVVPCQYSSINNSDLPTYGEGLIPFCKDYKWGFLDNKGTVLVEPKYSKARSFKDGYACVEMSDGSIYSISNKAGYVDRTGKEVIPPKYYKPFLTTNGLSDGMMAVNLPESYGKNREGYIGIDGTEYFNKTYNMAGDYKSGMAPAQIEKDGQFGYINKSGEWVILPNFSYAYPFNDDGIAQVSYADNTWGLIDKNGKSLVKGADCSPVSFLGPGYYSDGLMEVKTATKYGYMDAKGEMAIPLKFDYAAGSFSDGIAVVNNGCTKTKGSWGLEDIKGGTWMIIDKNGNVKKTLSGNYDEVSGFSDGMAVVKKDDKYGYINTDGTEIVAPTWAERPESFHNGLGRFYLPGSASYAAVKPFGYVNKQGKIVWEASM